MREEEPCGKVLHPGEGVIIKGSILEVHPFDPSTNEIEKVQVLVGRSQTNDNTPIKDVQPKALCWDCLFRMLKAPVGKIEP